MLVQQVPNPKNYKLYLSFHCSQEWITIKLLFFVNYEKQISDNLHKMKVNHTLDSNNSNTW